MPNELIAMVGRQSRDGPHMDTMDSSWTWPSTGFQGIVA